MAYKQRLEATGQKTAGKSRIQKSYQTNSNESVLLWTFCYLGEYTRANIKELSRNGDEVQTERRVDPKAVNGSKTAMRFSSLLVRYDVYCRKTDKTTKNGNVHIHDYYRCTRKSKTIVACKGSHIRAEELDKQLSNLLLDFCYAHKVGGTNCTS